MIERLITLCFNRRSIGMLVFALVAAYGWYSSTQLPLEGDHVHVNIRDCSQPVMR